MGKTGGYLEYGRTNPGYRPQEERVKDFKAVERMFGDEELTEQAARCMSCGTPFCHGGGCPLDNIIPEFNDLAYKGKWQEALNTLLSTASFPEFTGRLCPAPCETACTLDGLQDTAVSIRQIELNIIEKAFQEGYIRPAPPSKRFDKRVAVIGSGPAGLAVADYLNKRGYSVVVYDKDLQPGGIMRYGIPDFKMEKWLIDRRLEQMETEGVEFRVNHVIGHAAVGAGNKQAKPVNPKKLLAEFDAVVLAGGAELPRDLPVPGRELDGVHFAMEFLPLQNRRVAGDKNVKDLWASGKHVIVIGGGDTGSDCVGTSNRHGAASVTQFELLPMPPDLERNPVWPYWPQRLRTSSSHEEGVERDWSIATKEFVGENGKVKALKAVRLEWKDGRMSELPDSEFIVPADLVLLAMGFVSPVQAVLDALGVDKDQRGNARASTDGDGCYLTSVPKVFAAGDMRRGQSLVVWAIREGRQCARAVDEFLMGFSELPR